MSLRATAFRAMFWVALARYSIKFVSFLTNLVLARLLAPEAFGLVGITSVVLNSVQLLKDMGLRQTLIARKDNDVRILNAAFSMSVAISIILVGVTMLLAPLVASFFDNDAITPMLRILSINLILSSLSTVPGALLEKELRFRSLTLPQILASVGFVFVSIPLAFMGYGAWSIVWGSIVGNLLSTSSTWLLVRWRPTPQFDKRAMQELFAYSKHIVSISIGLFLQRNLDTAFVGKFLGTTAVGYYGLPFSLANGPALMLTNVVRPVLLPTCSKIQEQRERLANLHLRLHKFFFLALTLILLCTMAFAEEGIMLFYGAKWQPAIVPLQILCWYALFRNMTTTNGSVLLVVKKAKYFNRSTFLSLVPLFLFAIPAMRVGGLTGISLVMVLVALINYSISFYLILKTFGMGITSYFRVFAPPICAGIASTLVMIAISHLFGLHITDYSPSQFVPNLVTLSLKASLLIVSYAGIMFTTDASLRSDVRTNLSQLFQKGTFKAFLR